MTEGSFDFWVFGPEMIPIMATQIQLVWEDVKSCCASDDIGFNSVALLGLEIYQILCDYVP